MNREHCNFAVKLAGAFLLTSVATAEQDTQSYYIDSNDSLSLSMRFGLNMSGKFLGTGGSVAPYDNGKRTPNGDLYNYDNGYVIEDVAQNTGNQTYYYGFDNASQITGVPRVQQYLTLDQTVRSPVGGAGDSLYDPRIGAELTYNHHLGTKENWHHLRYGIEIAANYTPIEFNDVYQNGDVTETTTPYTFSFAAGTAAPSAPFQGNYYGPNANGSSYAILNSTPTAGTPFSTSASFIAKQYFKGDLWGFRLGPYIEMPLSRKLTVHVSGGFAVGLLDDTASWSETTTPSAAPGNPSTVSGGGNDLSVLYGEYARLNFAWQFDKHWGAEVGAQFQNLGIYDHDFGGRTVELDLSRSIFVEAGISYSF